MDFQSMPMFQHLLVTIHNSLYTRGPFSLSSSRTHRIYHLTASPITEDGPVLKEENCLFPWGWLSCLKTTAQEIPLRDPSSLTFGRWRLPGDRKSPAVIVNMLTPAVAPLTPARQVSSLHLSLCQHSFGGTTHISWRWRKPGAVNVFFFFKASAEIH